MILPTKMIKEHHALIGVGGELLLALRFGQTISTLWDSVKNVDNIFSFERFILGLDLLFMLGLIDWEGDKLIRKHHAY